MLGIAGGCGHTQGVTTILLRSGSRDPRQALQGSPSKSQTHKGQVGIDAREIRRGDPVMAVPHLSSGSLKWVSCTCSPPLHYTAWILMDSRIVLGGESPQDRHIEAERSAGNAGPTAPGWVTFAEGAVLRPPPPEKGPMRRPQRGSPGLKHTQPAGS